ncbi:MAG: hypothetical protein JWL90_4121 [Chthoniobacteraceae bacterium]|nr:hypothetical protein [Chthoniobacteraceae bacterium]
MIVLPQKNALRLLPLLNDSTKIEAGYLEIQDLIKSGDAELAAELVAKAVDGAKGVSKSVEEIRYPTEFDPPQLPVNVAKEKQLETFKAWPVVGVTPTRFETREVGATLEFTASVLRDGLANPDNSKRSTGRHGVH